MPGARHQPQWSHAQRKWVCDCHNPACGLFEPPGWAVTDTSEQQPVLSQGAAGGGS